MDSPSNILENKNDGKGFNTVFNVKNTKEFNRNKKTDYSNVPQCKDFPNIPHILPMKKDIYVLGDIHGDFDMLIKILKQLKLINNDLKWSGGKKVLVQVGDLIDFCRPGIDENGKRIPCSDIRSRKKKFADDLRLIKYVTELANQARSAGGHVILLLGNHEVMNIEGDFNYVAYADMGIFSGEEDYTMEDFDNMNVKEKQVFNGGIDNFDKAHKRRVNFFKAGSKLAQYIACTRQTAVIIGDILFVHAGLIDDVAENMSIEELNDAVRKYLVTGVVNKNDCIFNIKDILTSSSFSPLWTRILGNLKGDPTDTDTCVDNLHNVVTSWKVGNMVVGHTPQMSRKIGLTCTEIEICVDDGSGECKIFRSVIKVDTALSDGFSDFLDKTNKAQVLHISSFIKKKGEEEIRVIRMRIIIIS